MKDVKLTIKDNIRVNYDTFLMTLIGDTSEIKNAGEFINITVPGYYLRRPISVCEFGKDFVKILYKVLGRGTENMSTWTSGMEVSVLVGLGNGFPKKNIKTPLLVAGGIGIAPLIGLAKEFNSLNIKPLLVYGARSKDDLVMLEELNTLTTLYICTDDGSLGFQGNAVEFLKQNNLEYDYYYSCGPQKMLEFLSKYDTNGCVSLEARMGCGFGACMGCSIETISGPKRVCKEGPVFEAGEVKW